MSLNPPPKLQGDLDPLTAPKWDKGNSSPPSALRKDLSKKAEISLTYR